MKLRFPRFFSGSFALRLSLRFMFILMMAVISLSLVLLLFTRSVVFASQTLELQKAEQAIYQSVQKNIFNDTPGKSLTTLKEIPYYMTYLVYESENMELIATNDPFLPLLEDTNGSAKTLFIKDYFFDGDLNILYVAESHVIYGKTYIVSVALNLDNDSLVKTFIVLPKVIGVTIIPILIISFFVSLLITKRTIRPVIKITKTAQSITSENLGELLPLSEYDDEINELSKTFNRLFKQLKIDFERERQFSSDVSHELNTPLTVIIGQTGLLLRWGKDNPEQLEKSLNAIKQESKSMQAIIANLLQMSRIESGRVKPNFSTISLKDLFARLSDEVSALSADSHITYEIQQQKHNDIPLTTDSEMLHQILTVLISNSVKFSGGTCEIQLRAQKTKNAVIIEEIDDGPGFAEETLPHIFERFYRGDEAHSRKVSGSGLGLSIAQTLITALGGTIRAQNAEPHGAQFTIEIPLSE